MDAQLEEHGGDSESTVADAASAGADAADAESAAPEDVSAETPLMLARFTSHFLAIFYALCWPIPVFPDC